MFEIILLVVEHMLRLIILVENMIKVVVMHMYDVISHTTNTNVK